MCNEREKLIGYLYDEVDANERRSVEAHLSTCETCQDELRAFRAVRQDLLAWDVPPHESVWKPFVTTRSQPMWWQMPAWSLAAAAALVFAIGGAGGFAGRALAAKSEAPAQVALVQPTPEPANVTPAATLEDLRALQARLVELEHATSARTVSTAPVSMSASSNAALIAQVEQLIRDSEGRANKKLSQQVLNIVGELQSQRLLDRAAFDQKLNDAQAQINGAMLRVMNNRSPEREQ